MKDFLTSLKKFLGQDLWKGIGAIVGIIALGVAIISIPAIYSSLFPKQELPQIPHVRIRPTPTNTIVPTPTHVTITPTPTHVAAIPTPTIPVTITPTPSPATMDTVQQAMQQFCTSLANGDENKAFALLTHEVQQSSYQGDVQKFWGDFGEYGSGTCHVISCSGISCNVALYSSMHPSCQDQFTFVDLGHHSWHITSWSSPNNSCN